MFDENIESQEQLLKSEEIHKINLDERLLTSNKGEYEIENTKDTYVKSKNRNLLKSKNNI